MGENQHNNPWAEKLLQVSLPDSGEAWRAMEDRLNERMPQWRTRDRRRWILLILLLLLLIGVCNCPGRNRLFHGNATVRREPAPASPGSDRIIPGPTPPVQHTPPAKTAAQPRLALAPIPPTTTAPPGSTTSTSAGFTTPTPTVSPRPVRSKQTNAPAIYPTISAGAKPTHPAHTALPDHDNIADTLITSSPTSPIAPAASHMQRPPAKSDSLGKPPGRIPALTKSNPPKDSSKKKPPTPPKEKEQKEREHGLMAAIGLNQFFPLGGQQSVYNSSGTSGTLSDYIPVPVLRYYFSHKLYLQVEAQINTPQATKKNLVISSPPPDTTTISGQQIVSSASLQQLFYFNIPLSVHYTLFDHFDLGTGLQFSRLTNAIGSFDSTITPILIGNNPALTPVSSKDIKSFKGEALYQKIKTDEFRFLLDMSYTYKHFIGGLRYNQALSKFVNIQVAPGQVAQGRNSSLQLYLRYILWDGRK